jgi:catechol 2,3-dioxygenase-like lactoylglutathione lyase family enzyme
MEHSANEPAAFLARGVGPMATARRVLSAAIAIVTLLIVLPSYSAVTEIKSIGLTVQNLDREENFYTNVLGFVEVSRTEAFGPAVEQMLGLPRAKVRTAELRLGEEFLTLTQHKDGSSKPIPADSRSNDRWFQHIAIVVSDMDRAFAQLASNKVKFISTAPQVLPEWNPNAGGIKAFYFRDPEDHVLEVINFPPGKGDPRWQGKKAALFLGIDHTAIVVSDTDRSLAFYRDALGMRVAGMSENYGVEQEHLNQLFGARLRITALRVAKGPGIEFIEYITPPGGRELPADASASDLIFWRIYLQVDRLDELATFLKSKDAIISKLSGLGGSELPAFIARDLDGHALQFMKVKSSAQTAASGR